MYLQNLEVKRPKIYPPKKNVLFASMKAFKNDD